jgi:hypothetical protein
VSFDAAQWFATLEQRLLANQAAARSIGLRVLFRIEGAGEWFVDASETGPRVLRRNPGGATAILAVTIAELEAAVTAHGDGAAFALLATGKLKVLPSSGPAELADAGDDDVPELWTRLSDWAWAYDAAHGIPTSDEMTETRANEILDAADAAVGPLSQPEWESASDYFEAENFHGLVDPARQRAQRRG